MSVVSENTPKAATAAAGVPTRAYFRQSDMTIGVFVAQADGTEQEYHLPARPSTMVKDTFVTDGPAKPLS